MNADGSNEIQLTNFDGFEQAPTWSPDGSRIAFVRGINDDARGFGESGELWVIGTDGTDPQLLLADQIGAPAWSPDGSRIAVELRREETHLGILDLDTGTLDDLGEGHLPQWSPDGARLVYVSIRQDGGSDLFTIDADGSNRTRLTNDPSFETLPMWSPDAPTILYLTR